MRDNCQYCGYPLVAQTCDNLCEDRYAQRKDHAVDAERPTCELCGHPMPEGEEMFKFHGYSGPCPGPRTRPMGGVPEVIELHGEKWVRMDVVRKQEARLAEAEAEIRRLRTTPYTSGDDDGRNHFEIEAAKGGE